MLVNQYIGYGILNVKIVNNGTTLEAKFYDNDGESIKDQFTITKSQKKPSTYSLNKNLPMNNALEINYKNTNHTGLKIETVLKGIRSPTNFAF